MMTDTLLHRHLTAILKSGEPRAVTAVEESIEAIYSRHVKETAKDKTATQRATPAKPVKKKMG